MHAPRAKPLPALPAPPPPTNNRECWLDAAGNLARAEAQMAQTFYGGCAFPYVTAGLGPGSLVVELASNDGYLLRNYVEKGVPVLGIDPVPALCEAAEKIDQNCSGSSNSMWLVATPGFILGTSYL